MEEESIHQNYLKVGTSCDYDLVNDNDRICWNSYFFFRNHWAKLNQAWLCGHWLVLFPNCVIQPSISLVLIMQIKYFFLIKYLIKISLETIDPDET
jgi:hypothetical protein